MTNTESGAVADLLDVIPDLPIRTKDEVERDAQIAAIISYFDEGIKMVLVDGPEGVGKTTMLAQFCRQNPNSCISLFLGNGSSYALEIGNVRWNLYSQIKWILKAEKVEPDYDPEDGELKYWIGLLQRNAHRFNRKYYFLVDGLYESDKQKYNTIKDYIYDLFPLGARNIGVVASGRNILDESSFKKKMEVRSVVCPPFGLRETKDFFYDYPNKDQLESIHKICKGNPGFLSAVKRVIESGVDFGEDLSGLPDALPELFEIEWKQMLLIGGEVEKIVAIVSYSLSPLTKKEISSIVGIKKDELEVYIKKIPFLECDEEFGTVRFINTAYQRFSASKLTKIKEEIIELIIEDMMSHPDDDHSIQYLPKYYSKYGKNEDLLKVLDGDHLVRILLKNKNISSVMEYVNYGIDAAENGKKGHRLHLAKSCISSLTASVASKSEVSAALALEDREKAFYIADSVTLDEDRLYLLSAIAAESGDWDERAKKQLANSIEVVSLKISPELIGEDRCSEIAQDLFGLCPEVAISLIENSLSNDENDNKDWALARLSLDAMARKSSGEGDNESIKKVKSRISDGRFRDIFSAAETFIEEHSISALYGIIDKFERISDKLLFIRYWCSVNKSMEGAASVTRKAIDLAISDSSFVPSASFYNDISTTLPNEASLDQVNDIIRLIDGQRGLIKEKGPTLDYVSLQLNIAEAEHNHSFERFIDRISDLYLDFIDSIEDLVVKVDALAILMAFVTRIDPEKEMEEREGLHSSIEHDFDYCIKQALACTAEQAEAFCSTIEKIAHYFPDKALSLSESLNSVHRCDRAYQSFIESLLQEKDTDINWPFIDAALQKIRDINRKDDALHAVFERFADLKSNDTNKYVVDLFMPQAYFIIRPSVRARSLICALSFYKKSEISCLEKMSSIMPHVFSSWDAIDTPWIKIDVGFRIASDLSKIDIDEARRYAKRSENLKNEVGAAESEESSYAEYYATRLAIKSFYALLLTGKDTEEDFKRLEQAITCTECQGMAAAHWSLVALAYHMAGNTKECSTLFFKYVQPVINKISSFNDAAASRISLFSSPAFWVSYKDSAVESIKSLRWPYSDHAFYRIANFLLEKVWPDDPYTSSPGDGFELDYSEALQVIEVAGYIEDDYSSCEVIRRLIDSLAMSSTRSKMTGEQRNDLYSKIDIIVDSKYPTFGFIKHDGYKLYLKSYLSRLSSLSWPEWDSLIKEAREIPNISDRVFVLGAIVENIPSKHSANREAVLKEVRDMVPNVLSTADKMSRYHHLAEIFWPINPAVARVCIKEGLLKSNGDDSLAAKQKLLDLVDLANKVDPDLPDKIIDSSDSDPVRIKIREEIKKQSKKITFRKSLVNSSSDVRKLIKDNKRELPRAAWKNLGLLHAGKARPLSESQCRFMSVEAANFPISRAYPIYAWIIESLRVKYSKTAQAVEFIRPIFEASCDNVLLLESMVGVAFGDSGFIPQNIGSSDLDANNRIIGKGEKKVAIDLISSWLHEASPDEIIFSDPYFCPRSFELLRIISDVCGDVSVSVLTSLKHQADRRLLDDIENKYRASWVREYGEISPPSTDIAVAGLEGGGGSPVHDRWLVSNKGGIRLGTSFNSIGGMKDSEISFLTQDEASEIKLLLESYLHRRVRVKDGKKVNISFFEL